MSYQNYELFRKINGEEVPTTSGVAEMVNKL